MRKIGLICTLLLASSGAAYAGTPKGIWTAPERTFVVRVDHCGRNLCGRIVGLKEPTYANGEKKIDRHNEKASLRSRPLMGLGLFLNMRPAGENMWKGAIKECSLRHSPRALRAVSRIGCARASKQECA